jgi:Flp pilus assembly secretin CpaC
MTTRFAPILCALGALLLVQPGSSDTARAAEERVHMTVGRSDVLRPGKSVSDIVIGDPRIIDVIPASGPYFILNAQAVGSTNIIVVDERGEVILNRVIQVNPDANELVVRSGQSRRVYLCSTGCAPVGPGAAATHALQPSRETGSALEASNQAE